MGEKPDSAMAGAKHVTYLALGLGALALIALALFVRGLAAVAVALLTDSETGD